MYLVLCGCYVDSINIKCGLNKKKLIKFMMKLKNNYYAYLVILERIKEYKINITRLFSN